ncbi:MAG: CBS domain-containing protein, partial [Thermomicrobiaceae bacterium]|nr:CBS domain-containing protein [Thermomicrobiaceae bacterium]
MVEAPHISDMLVPDVDVIGPDEPVRAAQRRMEAQTRRSLIVVEGDRPIGVVQWRDIMRVQGPESDQPVRDFMVREVPVLKTDMTLDEARAQLTGEVDLDRLPVVNEQGQLVGEVPRQAVVHQAAVVEPGAAGVTEREVVTGMRDTGDQFATTETAERAFQLQKGMD